MLNLNTLVDEHKAQVEFMRAMQRRTLSTMEELSDLHMQASRDWMSDHARHSLAMFDMAGKTDARLADMNPVQPLMARSSGYWRHLVDIGARLASGWGELLHEQVEATQAQYANWARNVYVGFEQGTEPMTKVILATATIMNGQPEAANATTRPRRSRAA